MNTWESIIAGKVRWGVVQRTVYFSSIDSSRFFIRATPFFCIFITVNEGWSNNVVYNYVGTLIITIDPWCVIVSIFHGYIESINRYISNICISFQSTIIINYHKLACMSVILKFFQDEADDYDWCSLGGGGEDTDNSCISAYISEHCGEATDRSGILECKFQV